MDRKNLSVLSYNSQMSPSEPAEAPDIILEVKQWGERINIRCTGVSNAIEQAVAMIESGQGIPKSISVNGMVIYTEGDINTYWSEKFRK